ncbi:MAG: amino acid ABC transporter permease [Synechococcus sp. TMED187]|jgi:general L-amino acid transport system permease protein|uniref:amino acid ABC transporter permease n=1 Tax=Synechococcus sp. MIT S9451 TaxID=3082543 RepID=UPI000B6DCF95|nr:MAG: amino acid ABC transporter permease [Synechococcus sp. TMED187]RZO14504.1 MAG: amino acid ABC transporter permease [Synechococcus sp. MED-G135]
MRACKALIRHCRFYPIDSVLSLGVIALIIWVLWASISWIVQAADWSVVSSHLPLFASGSYPPDQRWRPLLWISLLAALTLITLIVPIKRGSNRWMGMVLPWCWVFMIPLGLVLMAGGLGLTPVPSRAWGGISLTLLLTVCSAVLALPFGILLALGRTSDLPVLRHSSRLYIDVMRAVPLIAVLFFGKLLIPLFLPMQLEINQVLRAVVAFALFAAAYVAEDVRGGLQAIPETQREAAAVLGLSPLQSLQLVVLPQALRIAIPALTNQAIGLLQNTSLMALLGLVELLGIAQNLLANPAFIGRHLEVYVWLGALYWLFCTAMALLARKIEHSGPTLNGRSA